MSNVAAKKAADELKAEQAALRQCEERMSTMACELKEATVWCEFLERDNNAKAADPDKALQEAREARSESRAAREEIRQAGEIAAGKPFLYRLNLVIRSMPCLIRCGAPQTHFWTCRRVWPMRLSFSTRERDMRRKSYFGRNLSHQSVHS